METTTLNPQYIYVQATEPSDKTEGKLWYNTTASALYSSDGTNYLSMDTDTTLIQKLILENGVQILINSAGATTTLNDWDDMFIDNFSDSGGYLNTVDEGNTTATFSSDKYIIGSTLGNETTDAHGVTPTSKTGGATHKLGMLIEAQANVQLTTVTKFNLCTGTKCYLYNSDGTNLIDTQTFSGDLATFNQTLTSGLSYRIQVDKEGAGYDWRYEIGDPLVEGTNIDWLSGIGTGGTGCMNNIASVKTKALNYSSKLVQTNVETIKANPLAHQVYCKNSLTENASIDYNISFDNGSTWITEQELNTKNSSVHNGTQLILKINLNPDGSNLATASNYAVMLFY